MIKKRNQQFMAVWVMIVLVLASCSSKDENMASKSSEGGGSSTSMKRESAKEDKQPAADQGRKMIYTSEIMISVQNVKKVRSEVEQLTKQMGGYIVESESLSEEEGQNGGYLKIRIPKKDFLVFTKKAGELSSGSPHEIINGRDVTEEYTDLEARLKAKRIVRNRLESFMKNANKTEDLLAISKELSGVQEQIEKIQGRINYLENQSDFSTVTVHFEVKNIGMKNNEELNTWGKSKTLFKETWNGLVHTISYLIIALIGLSPVIILFMAIGGAWLYLRRIKRSKKETKP
ncbi:DUF4349 domain-containing protein [Fictibacillus sp. KIGAM418]|uniref:DUF4349 domain-containing protein n=1 Tax=Fictibacillus marinisediminis TaxID=2878389 RepID=A0A9X1X9U4_9BACL|nr:DUF4349 domain-containing protein [Fictibacillus marinisediminis]MCK6256578.1 DUF4349 domain-containing protein [Fictibacillus marinisediminis]